MKQPIGNCTIYIIRHGESEWNSKGLIQGRSDSKLTVDGEEQAVGLAKELEHIKFDAIFSSTLMRAKRTADIISVGRDLKIKTRKALVERSFGKLDGKKGKHIKVFFDLQKKADAKKLRLLGIESDEEIADRMFTLLNHLAKLYMGKKILIVTHGSLVRTLFVHLGYATLEQIPPFSVGNGAFVELEFDGARYLLKNARGINLKLDSGDF